MHLLAERIILAHLIKIGIVKEGFDMAELQDKRVGAVFFPHGLGHFLGLKVHDLGGYTEGPERSKKAGLKSLRTRRILKEGMVITVEPGLYFIEHIIKNALNNPELQGYLNKEKIDEYMHVGGVRLEDDVLVTKTGAEVLSSLPREAKEVEEWLAGHY
jgi:Xaa-Pro dipeptidase